VQCAWHSRGKIDNIRWRGGWWDRLHFSTGRSKSNDPPGRNCGKHDKDDGVWAETARGWCGGFVIIKGFLINFSAGWG